MGVATLVLGTFINVLHAVSDATLVIMSVPEKLSEFDLSVDVLFANWVGDSVCHTCGPKGGGDLKPGTAGMSVNSCSSSSTVVTCHFFGRTVVIFMVLGEGLPIPGIDFFDDFHLLTLAVANLELANSL